ncbi:MAG TPA: LPS export ABC transporter periplasmic protein LptC [Geomonas sp.]
MYKLNNIRRFLAIVASLAALFVVATIAFRMQRGGAPARRVPKLPLQVDVSLQKVHYTETKHGVKRWDLSADRAEFNRQANTTSLTGVRLVVAGRAAAGELLVTADRADYDNKTRDVVLQGNVHGQSGSGIEFSTSRVTYVSARSQLETNEPVRFKDKGLQLEGVGMEFQTQTRKLKLMRDVSAVYRPQEAR